jgi:hypothetical protein
MKSLFLVVLVSLFAVVKTIAHPIDGKWKSSFEGPQGAMELTFEFKVEGDKLTGKIISERGEILITNGKVNGNEFSYQILEMGSPRTQKGKLEGEVIKIKMEMPEGRPGADGFEMVLKKVKE